MHAVRRALLASQAAALGLPVVEVLLPTPCSNEAYAEVMGRAVAEQVAQGISHIAFGDLFLEDVRRYREEKLAGTGLTPVFPLWQQPTAQLAREMLAAGVRAVITCVDPRQVDPGLCGRDWDAALIAALPPEADPCGERGEFHTFVWDGPMFLHGPVKFERGEVVLRDGFVFADLFPADSH
jgi:diphthamide synthase (EF-2-diphthine--ammonia ligase)